MKKTVKINVLGYFEAFFNSSSNYLKRDNELSLELFLEF